MERHIEFLNVELRSDRADIAPMISSLQSMIHDRWQPNNTTNDNDQSRNRPEVHQHDDDVHDDGTIRRQHKRPRRQLFTPLREHGSPPVKSLTKGRTTLGMFVDNGERFTIIDEWTNGSSAHLDLGRWWTGTTVFKRKSKC